MKQLACILGISATGVLTSLYAGSVALNNVGITPATSLVITYSGTSTPASGGIAAAGYFATLTDAQVLTLSADLGNIASLVADFQIVTTTTLDSAFGGNLPNSGLFDVNNASVTLPNSTLSGRGLYTFLGNQATLGGSNQFLLWNNTDSIDAQDTVAQPDDNTLLMAQEGSALISGRNTTAIVDFSPIGGGSGVAIPAIQLAAVPELSSFILSTFCIFGLLRRKR